jgi:hypothetical protein
VREAFDHATGLRGLSGEWREIPEDPDADPALHTIMIWSSATTPFTRALIREAAARIAATQARLVQEGDSSRRPGSSLTSLESLLRTKPAGGTAPAGPPSGGP